MAICKMQPGSLLFCATPVENLFIEEYLPQAPAEYVKVYLYGLMNCYYPDSAASGISQLAQVLSLTEEQVREAFNYWQEKGLVQFQFENGVSSVLYKVFPRDTRGFVEAQDDPNRFLELNRNIEKLFEPRQLTPRELDSVHRWIDSYRFPEESAILLCQYCIRMHGRDVAIAYMNTVAENWASEGLIAPEKIREHLELRSAERRDVISILASLGIIKRSATEAEMALYKKWTENWGFDRDAIDYVCLQSASAKQPNMKYIDTILNSLRENNLFTRAEIEMYLEERNQQRRDALEIQQAMGVSGAPSPTLIQCMQTWRSTYGYDVPVFLLAAKEIGMRGQKTLGALENVLKTWNRMNLLSQEDVQRYLENQDRATDDVSVILQRLHLEYAPNEQSRQAYLIWTNNWNFSMDAILRAADEVVNSGIQYNRMQALHRMLQDWYNRGITGTEASVAPPQAPAAGEQNESLNYSQRSDSMDDVLMDL